MKVLFTTTDEFTGRLVRAVTGEPYSHVAILVGSSVIHSAFNGVELLSLDEYLLRGNRIIDFVPVAVADEHALNVFTRHQNSWYDVGGLLMNGLQLCLRRVGLPAPKVNLWQMTGMFMCTELVSKIVYDEELSLITPGGLYKLLWEDYYGI